MGHLEFDYSTLHLSWLHLKAFTVLLLEVAAQWEEPPLHGCILICLLNPASHLSMMSKFCMLVYRTCQP